MPKAYSSAVIPAPVDQVWEVVGDFYSEDNVRERLAIRNLMQDLRSTGELLGGPAPFGHADRQRFANHLDRFLTKHRRSSGPCRTEPAPQHLSFLVVGTGVDPVTFRFSGGRSAN